MTTTIDHTNCDHEATKVARAACRKARTARTALCAELIEVFNEGSYPTPHHWVWYAARRFAKYEGDDLYEAADSILTHFLPSGDEEKDAYRRRNDYIITEDLHRMRSITLRAAS